MSLENPAHLVAEVALHFENQTSDPLGPVVCLVREDLVRKRIHAAARFAGSDGTENGNARIETPLGNHKPFGIRRRGRFTLVVNLSSDKEKLVALARFGVTRQASWLVGPPQF